MNIQKTVKKIVALGAGAGLVGATLMSAFAVAPNLATYPSFVMDGNQFDGKIVVGARAAAEDILGAIDIAASLQAASTSPVNVGDSTTVVDVDGDAKKIENTGDMLEIGEPIGSVVETLTDDDLAMLSSGRITTRKGTTEYTQTLEFDDTTSGDVRLAKNFDDVVDTYLYFEDGTELFRYTLDFTSGLRSSLNDDDEAYQLEGETLYMLGQAFTIVEAKTDGVDEVELVLMAGDVSDTLSEGQTKTYNIDGVDYEVTVLVIGQSSSGPSAKFLVNGQVTRSLAEKDTDLLADGLQIGVREIISTTAFRESDPSSIVEFYLGANKIVLTDSDITDASNTDNQVDVGTDRLRYAEVQLSGSIASDELRLDLIEYTVTTKADRRNRIYVSEGEGVKEYLSEPEGMFNPDWDIMFFGMSEPTETVISFESNGDERYDFLFENRKGQEISVPFLYTSGGTNLQFGDEDNAFIFEEVNVGGGTTANASGDFFISLDDYFVLTDGGGYKADTFVLQFIDVDDVDSLVILDDVGTGNEVTAKWTSGDIDDDSDPATGTITMSGKSYDFWVWDSDGAGTYKLAVDLDRTGGLVDGDKADIVTRGGAVITFGDIAAGEVNMSVASDSEMVDSDDEQEVIVTFTASGGELDLSVDNTATGGNGVSTVYQESFRGGSPVITLDRYGAWFEEEDRDNSPNALNIYYPLQQREALVYIVGGAVQASSHTTGTGTAERVNVLPVGLAVLDTEIRVDAANLIVVGGPCANSIAAALLDNPANCAEGFEPGMGMIRTFDTGNNVAVLTAGFSARDTVQTAQVLAQAATRTVANFQGDSVEVVIAGANDVSVRAAQ